MTSIFFWVATVITAIFFILVLVLFVCQWVIYTRVEKTMLRYDHFQQKKEERN
ncbi:hypothetical protein [Limosilactobacillus sp.]|jgi:uncharacterized membrane protein YdbT with pleckstrin-like domain|uniref:hypothetical protein n=1 Tax=Limosilactobacillus sp. TaxID=2773925 RepID=UPI0025BB8C42|nr:hypothetical protein [Limosilactobacillus sp.]MCH3922796.1 hypothetical protein [Limosilactobacillus sp.]MCH3927479.1 hypothetical protein [Limosilactobacillus sp.]